MSERNLMPIGRFARSCRLSVKALRHYDELGLLRPAVVDASSGYRYYERRQARDAVMIGMLRSLDVPLAVIQRALEADAEALAALLQTESARIEAEIAARRTALLSLQHIVAQGSLTEERIEVETLAPMRAACARIRTNPERLVPDSTDLIEGLLRRLAMEEIRHTNEIFTINAFAAGGRDIEVTAAVELADPADAQPTFPADAFDGGTCARLRHTGPYETLGLAHHALFAWSQERGHEAPGPIWEFYRNDPADTPPEALITDVYLPLLTEPD